MSKKKKSNSKKPTSQLANKPNKYQRKQQRYFEKKQNSQTVAPISKLKSLDALKEERQDLIDEANHRINQIRERGYTSKILSQMEKETGQEYFSLDSVKSNEDLIREVTRVRVFLADKGSTITGAQLETAQISAEQYRGKFGNEYNTKEHNFARYDTTVIKKEYAEKVFEMYRNLESFRSAHIDEKLQGYGSENLIIALYDAEVRGIDGYTYATDLLDAFVSQNKKGWEPATRGLDETYAITGEIQDNLTGRYLY